MRDFGVPIASLIATVLILVFGVWYETSLYRKADVPMVEAQLQKLGFTNIQVGDKKWEFGGLGRCTREDVASFDFVATSDDNKVIDNMYACAGIIMRDRWNPQITVRFK